MTCRCGGGSNREPEPHVTLLSQIDSTARDNVDAGSSRAEQLLKADVLGEKGLRLNDASYSEERSLSRKEAGMGDALCGAALAYAQRGWPVLPIKPRSKVPVGNLVPHGARDATTDPRVIRSWWDKLPAANVGIATGIAFDALDLDGELGQATINNAIPPDAPTLSGPTVQTGGGGLHCYWQPTGLGNRARFLPNCDWRGVGGYVVAPPSRHESGTVYRWKWGENETQFGFRCRLAPVPDWLLELLTKPMSRFPTTLIAWGGSQRNGHYGQHALEAEVGRVLLAPEGQRNDQLNRSSFALGGLVGGGVLCVDDVVEGLLTAALRTGLPVAEARRTIASGLGSGAMHPRSVK